eukprot:COSAG01_NODE_2006_length_8667_cov_36.171569_3_plen_175_part_00
MFTSELSCCDTQAVVAENLGAGRIATSKAELQIVRAEAYTTGEAGERQARAKVEEIEARACAEAALADAERVEAVKRAELEAPAKAMKAKVIIEAQAQAEETIVKARGKAEATYIQVRKRIVAMWCSQPTLMDSWCQMEAEAKGQFEILEKKAQGLGALVAVRYLFRSGSLCRA